MESLPNRNRIYFLDNLRTFLIFLVVLIHTGLVYESSGIPAAWWIVDDPATNDLSGIINLVIDIFVMAAIFFVSGYFAPSSLRRKGTMEFLKSKFKRLIVPWIVASLVLLPLYKFLFLYSRGLPQENWITYFHWSNGIWSQNWLWFLPVLFLFDVLFVLLSRMGWENVQIRLRTAIGISFLIGLIYSVVMDFFQFQGWTKTFFFDFQNERLLIYFLVFMVGSLFRKSKAFESKPRSKKLYFAVSSTVWIPVNIYLGLIIFYLMNPGTLIFSDLVDTFLVQFIFMLSLISLLFVSINTFRFYFDKQGKIGRELSRNSYSVYIIHAVVLGILATLMMDSKLPSLLKYLLVTFATYFLSNLVVSIYRRMSASFIKKTYIWINGGLTHHETSS
jgi:fucose 4-O-acetylase-like acetyltransferase